MRSPYEVINCVRVVTQVPRYFKSGRDAPLDASGISTVLMTVFLNQKAVGSVGNRGREIAPPLVHRLGHGPHSFRRYTFGFDSSLETSSWFLS